MINNKKKYTIFGNCQTTALSLYLNENKEFFDHYEFQPIKLAHTIEEKDIKDLKETLNECDLIIYQHIADDYHIPDLVTSRLFNKSDVQLISFPSLYFNGYFPYLDVMNGKSSILSAVHDYNIMTAYLFGIDEESIYDMIHNSTFYSKELSEKLVNDSFDAINQRENLYTLDIKVEDFIKQNYQKDRLFHQFNHPSRKVFEYIRGEIFSILSISQKCEPNDIDYLNGIISVIYPSIYKNLNLQFDNYQNYTNGVNILDTKDVIKVFYEFYATCDRVIMLEWLLKRKEFILIHFMKLFPDKNILVDNKTMISYSQVYIADKNIHALKNGKINNYQLSPIISEKIGIYEKKNISIAGRGSYINNFKDKQDFFLERNLVPEFWRTKVKEMISKNEKPKYFNFQEKYLDENVIFISIPYGMPIYGHLLIEVLPKLFLLHSISPDILKKYKIVISNILPNWFFKIIYELFDIKRSNIITYNEFEEVITVKKAFIPSLLHTDYVLHPMMNLFVAYIKDKLNIKQISGYENIYISRKKLNKQLGYSREFINSLEVEDFFFKHKYKIIYPESLSFKEQIEIFSNAKTIVGQFGSGLHNTLFSNDNVNVISFQRHTMVQDHIARLRNQNLYHINRDYTNLSTNSFKIPINDIKMVLHQIKNNKE